MTYQTDKIGHGYTQAYVDISVRKPRVVVEIGIASGDGLAWFADIFPEAELTGIDRDMSRVQHCIGRGFGAFCFDQDDPGLALWLAYKNPRVDLIVDDASHDFNLTSQTFRNLWPILAPGGTYVIEDWSHVNDNDRYLAWCQTVVDGQDVTDKPESVVIDPIGLMIFRKST